MFIKLALVALFLGSCSWDSGSVKKELRLALQNPIKTLDPAKVYSAQGLSIIAQICEPLFEYHYLNRPYELKPLAAMTLPKVSEDKKFYEIKIKPDLFYHRHQVIGEHENKIEAKDFKFAIERVMDPKTKSPGRSFFENILKIETPDSNTIRFELKNIDPHFPHYLSMHFSCPLPKSYVDHFQGDLDDNLIGSGPYFLSQKNVDKVELNYFSKYRDANYPASGDRYSHLNDLLSSKKQKIPFLSKIQFTFIAKQEERIERFFLDQLDFVEVTGSYLDQVLEGRGEISKKIDLYNSNVKYFPSITNRWLSFNMNDPVIGKSINLRKAIAYAINYDQYFKEVTGKTGLRAHSIFTPGVFAYDPSKSYEIDFNLEKAKSFLTKVPSKDLKKLGTITYSTRSLSEMSLREGEFIKEQLQKLGLSIKIEQISFQDFLSKGRSGKLQFFTDNWIYDYPDPSNMLQLLVSKNHPGINKSGFSNKEYDLLYQEALVEKNLQLRKRKMEKMEKIVYDHLPWIMLSYERKYILSHPRVKNLRLSSFIRNYLKYVKIK